jgi:hypothetical protein
VAAGLTHDEFALWLRLDDVYWSKDGKSTARCGDRRLIVGGLVVLGLSPINTPAGSI